MSAGPQNFRGSILTAVQQQLSGRFSLSTGTEEKFLRSVALGPIRPSGGNRPCCYVSDGGQIRVLDPEDESSCERVLTVTVTVLLADVWERAENVAVWNTRVERVIAAVHKWLPSGCGMIRMDYVSDDPADVLFASGASEAAWEIVFEARYFVNETREG